MRSLVYSPFLKRAMSSVINLPADKFPPLLACHVYVSEGRQPSLIQRLVEKTTSVPSIAVLRVFEDSVYNRTGISVAGPPEPLQVAMESLAMAALETIDIRTHKGSHPRIGAVDHVSVHPLHGTCLEDAAEVARNVGEQIGSKGQVPVYLYGAAHSHGKSLADIRRSLGYFSGSKGGEWLGPRLEGETSILPDYGPSIVTSKSGCAAVGAVPWVVNFNVELDTQDLIFAKQVAKTVSERGGGLVGIQAMALVYESGSIEVACNILNEEKTPPSVLLSRIEELCGLEGIEIRRSYSPGVMPDDALEIWWNTQSLQFEKDGW